MKRITFRKAVVTFALLLACTFQVHAASTGWDMVPEILARIVPPTFPDIDYVITDYGAVGDGVTGTFILKR